MEITLVAFGHCIAVYVSLVISNIPALQFRFTHRHESTETHGAAHYDLEESAELDKLRWQLSQPECQRAALRPRKAR